jgi:hypothetical protein
VTSTALSSIPSSTVTITLLTTTRTLIVVSVVRRVGVAVRTVGLGAVVRASVEHDPLLCQMSEATADVLSIGDRLQVGRAAASPVHAQVVNSHSLGDGTEHCLPRESVNENLFAPVLTTPVPLVVQAASPDPATGPHMFSTRASEVDLRNQASRPTTERMHMSTNYITHDFDAPVRTWEDCAAVLRHIHTVFTDHIKASR